MPANPFMLLSFCGRLFQCKFIPAELSILFIGILSPPMTRASFADGILVLMKRTILICAKIAELDRTTTFAEDLQIVAQVQKGVENVGYIPGPLVLNPQEGIDSEHSVAVLHRLVFGRNGRIGKMKIARISVFQKTLPLANPYRLSGGRLLVYRIGFHFRQDGNQRRILRLGRGLSLGAYLFARAWGGHSRGGGDSDSGDSRNGSALRLQN